MHIRCRFRRARRFALLCLGLLVASVFTEAAQAQDDSHGWLRSVREGYRAFGRVDDELRWAPFLCRIPMPSSASVSRAPAGPHGRKVYFVYASNRRAYLGLTRGDASMPPVGFTVVKEAFQPRQVRSAELEGGGTLAIPGAPEETVGAGFPMLDPSTGQSHATSRNVYLPVRDDEGHLTGAGAPRGLYVMRYVGPGPGTDEGWVYGTVDAAGEITSAGLNESCMGCHRAAPHGRLFGQDG